MDENPKTNPLLELNKELSSSEGYAVVNRLFKFKQSLKIFLSNHTDLETAVRRLESSPLFDIRDAASVQRHDNDVFEIIRQLHNTVAAALSLVDHTRTLYETYYKRNGLIPEYPDQISGRFALDGVSQFVQCLRNFCLHYRTPLISSRTDFDHKQGTYTRSVRLAKGDLNKFSNWSKPARDYMSGLPESIDLLSVMNTYREGIVAFHDWLNQRLGEVHQAHLDEYNRLSRKIDEIHSQDLRYMGAWLSTQKRK